MTSLSLRSSLYASLLICVLSTALLAVPSRAADFDAAWARFFPADTVAYLAVREPIGDGPLIKRTLAGPGPAQLASSTQAQGSQLAAVVSDLTSFAKQEKAINVYLGELASKGFALGGAMPPEGKREADGLIVVVRTPTLDKFWPKAVEHLKATRPKDSVKDLTIDGMNGIVLTGAAAQPLCFLMAKDYLLVGTSEAILKQALDRSAKGSPSVTGAPYYVRVRPSVPRDALAFLAMNPAPVLERAAATEEDPARKERLASLKGRIDAMLGSFILSPKCLRADLLAFLPGKDGGAKMASLLRDHPMITPALAAADWGLFIGLTRPGDDLMNQISQSMGGLLNTARGIVQSNLGLDFDQDVAPWWGSELGFVADASGQIPEGALVLDEINHDAAGKALAKVERQLSVVQGKQFEPKTVDGTTIKAAKVDSSHTAVNPAMALLKGAVAIGSSSRSVEALAHKGKKLAEDPAFRELERVLPRNQTMLAIYVRASLISSQMKKAANPQGGAPGLPIPTRSLPIVGAQAESVAASLEEQVDAFLLGAGQPAPDKVLLSLVITGP